MRAIRLASPVIGLAFAFLGTPTHAKLLDFTYSGVVTAADNFDSGEPGLPLYTTYVGEMFNGSFSFDTDGVMYDDVENYYHGELSSITFSLPDQPFGEDFSGPGGLVASSPDTGETAVIGGRPDYGRQMSLRFALPKGQPFDGSSLYGRSASLSFDNYERNGFSIEGLAIVAPVPEPATWLTVGIGFAFAAGFAHRRKRSAWMQGTASRLRPGI